MCFERVFGDALVIAQRTSVGTFTRVGALMPQQLPSGGESFLAELALFV